MNYPKDGPPQPITAEHFAHERKIFSMLQSNKTTGSDAHDHILMPLDEFSIESPNGNHFAQIYELFGSTIGDIGEWGSNEFLYPTPKKVAKDALQAVNLLHENGIVHGCRFSVVLEPGIHCTVAFTRFIHESCLNYFKKAMIVLKSNIHVLEMRRALLCFEISLNKCELLANVLETLGININSLVITYPDLDTSNEEQVTLFFDRIPTSTTEDKSKHRMPEFSSMNKDWNPAPETFLKSRIKLQGFQKGKSNHLVLTT